LATTAEGGRDGDALEDVDAFCDHSIIKEQLELAVRMAEVVSATSEWHRRMTSDNLSQSGQTVDLEKYVIGHNAYFYKPSSMNKTVTRGRRAKHIDHYVGPGTIIKHLGTRSIIIRYKEKDFQRDAGMVMLEKPRIVSVSSFPKALNLTPLMSMCLSTSSNGIIPHHRCFILPWLVDRGVVVGNSPLPLSRHHVLIKLDKLEIPHHEGAGGAEDFTNGEAFQKHIRRVRCRLKIKRTTLPRRDT
jgi:hypothetical protein